MPVKVERFTLRLFTNIFDSRPALDKGCERLVFLGIVPLREMLESKFESLSSPFQARRQRGKVLFSPPREFVVCPLLPAGKS